MNPSPISPEGDATASPRASSHSGIAGTSEMTSLVRAFDWTSTPLGPISAWSETLRCAVNMVLAARIPMQLLWGEEMIVLYNDALKLFMTGKHPKALGQPGADVWSEAWPTVGSQLQDVLGTGEPLNFYDVFLPLVRNGVLEDMYWDYSYSPIYNPDGSVAGILNVAQNTTEKNLSRHALLASESQARRVLRSIGDAVIVTDADANVVRMNPVAEKLTGWAEPDAHARPLSDVFRIINEGTRREVESPASKVKRLGQVVGLANHTILLRRDGTEVHIDDSGAPIRDDAGALTGIVLVFRDIGERRQMEKERDAAFAQLSVINDALPVCISYLDRDLRYVHANRTYEEWFGSPVSEVLGKTIFEFLGDSTAGKIRGAIEQAFTGSIQHLEFTIPAKGFERVVKATYIPDFNDTGHARGVIVQGYDITELRRAEEALIQSEKLAAVGRLAASIAHEINNPLESVTNLLYLARADAQTDGLKEYLDTADRELRRVAAITNQTLRFHKQASRPTAIACDDLIDSVVSLYQGRIVNSRVRMEKRKRALQPVVCFTGEIRQVLSNLVGNAIDAMHPGGGRLIFRSRDGVDWKSGRRGIIITVADTGPGMTLHTMEKAFEPFFTTKGIGGTGLGLWISQEIMRRHGGTLRLRSSQRPGHTGTVFAFFLPYDAVTR